MQVEEVDALLTKEARDAFVPPAAFTATLQRIEDGDFGCKEDGFYQQILDALTGEDGVHYLPKDFYLLGVDWEGYIAAVSGPRRRRPLPTVNEGVRGCTR